MIGMAVGLTAILLYFGLYISALMEGTTDIAMSSRKM